MILPLQRDTRLVPTKFRSPHKTLSPGVSYSAYSPLGGWTGANVLDNPAVLSVAAAHHKPAAVVALRWVTQQNIVGA